MMMLRVMLALACLLAAGTFSGMAAAEPGIAILPGERVLSNVEDRQLLVVQQLGETGRYLGEVRQGVVLSSSNPRVVRIEDQTAVPVGNGEATITARVGSQTATAAFRVTGHDEPFAWSFRNHVESVLSKAGCNGGACHGARAGKNGFRLTLFGFDLEADHSYLTRQAAGRRVNFRDPGRSLVLTKPTGMLPHKGGVRFEPDSREYRVLAEWIAAGGPAPADSDPVIVKLDVLPKYSRQTSGQQQQLLVQAHFSDGHVEDVTRWAKYVSVNMSVANVGDHGLVDIVGPGEAAVKVWYLNWNEMAFLSAPFPNATTEETFAGALVRNFIDEHVIAKLKSLNLPPSPLCDDATFLRRAFLDTIGVLPTADETTAFLADKAVDKRSRLIDALLDRPEFVDYWSYKWSDLLLVSGERLRPDAVKAYYGWIRQQVEQNTPWDEFTRQIVTAKGSALEHGAANFYALHQDPTIMAETVSQAFMGLSINCAKCHNHPLEKWTNDQYYGMANLFSRVRAKGWGGDFRSGDGNRIIFTDTQGELPQPSTGRPQPPRPLDAEPLAFDDPRDRREYLADWLVSPDNPYFTRSIVNRVWANYFGVGLVEAVDDLRATNPASNEELLHAAADYLVEQDFDLKALMRAILHSSAYQRSSQSVPGNENDTRFYSHYYVRRLPAEVMLDALSRATSQVTTFKDQKEGVRALELSDAAVESYFLSTFGRPERLITCACERTSEPSMTQVLHLYNGDTVNKKLQAKGNRIEQLLGENATHNQIIDAVFLEALCRSPQPRERDAYRQILADAQAAEKADKEPGEYRRTVEDLYWAILSSREFLFNH
ncbi:DUF1549 and DUF1553 domain-containing protein [Lignipirellula cremea]|uniref:Bacterial Ig-like domain (Group 2) n=1 Tax=Lignipirellula cremea TaxID=2528010 RepID=A0A518DUC8_9BACT|nr:DUF1549 and DUF1553 domain-containing protein [Lignipirellula cremea]QDU95441.1 Bacterial Ig-like domain (group 2) [Lignipirellula cremea]